MDSKWLNVNSNLLLMKYVICEMIFFPKITYNSIRYSKVLYIQIVLASTPKKCNRQFRELSANFAG